MKISSRSRHAVTVMLELALQGHEKETPVIDLARKYEISQSSMEQLFAKLRHSGLVTGRRGRKGGYKLTEPATKISLADIIGAVDDSREKMNPEPNAQTELVWKNLSDRLYVYLKDITLAELMESAQLNTIQTEDLIIANKVSSALGIQTVTTESNVQHL